MLYSNLNNRMKLKTINHSFHFVYQRPPKLTLASEALLQTIRENVKENYPCNRPWRPIGCETLRLPHFLGNRFTDGSEVVSFTRLPSFNPQEDSSNSYLLEAEPTPGQ
jgi:hypothetical protein